MDVSQGHSVRPVAEYTDVSGGPASLRRAAAGRTVRHSALFSEPS
jgi:hypothetical protein